MRIEVIEERTHIDHMRAEWDSLALRSAIPSIYNTFDYVMCSWEHFDAHHSSLQIVSVRDADGALVGLLPLRTRRRRRGLETVLEQAATVEVDRVSLLAVPGTEAEVWAELLPVIAELSWDVWISAEVRADAVLHSVLDGPAAGALKFRTSKQDAGSGILMDLDLTWSDFLASHKSFRRRLKKFERLVPDYQIDVYTKPGEMAEGLEAYQLVASESWKAGEIGISRSDRVKRFYEAVMPRLAAEGRTAIRILRDGDELLASDITHTFGSTAFLHCAAYTEASGRHSPGTVFTGLVACELMKSEVSTGDLLTGHADYLLPWASSSIATYDVSVTRRGVKRSLLDAQALAQSSAKRLLKR